MLFGASDLIARGTSLLAMFPNSITTSVANLKRRLVHVKAALIIGLVAAVTAPFGTWIAGAVSPASLDSVRLLPVRAADSQPLRSRQGHSFRPRLFLTVCLHAAKA